MDQLFGSGTAAAGTTAAAHAAATAAPAAAAAGSGGILAQLAPLLHALTSAGGAVGNAGVNAYNFGRSVLSGPGFEGPAQPPSGLGAFGRGVLQGYLGLQPQTGQSVGFNPGTLGYVGSTLSRDPRQQDPMALMRQIAMLYTGGHG